MFIMQGNGKVNNPKLCKHEFKYAFNYQRVGMMHPDQIVVLYCSKCALIKSQTLKIPKK